MQTRLLYGCLVVIMFCVAGCGPNQRILESSNSTPAADATSPSTQTPPTVPSFEQDLNAMRIADFKFIVAFRRKDDAPMDAGDKELIGSQTGPQANRRRLSDNGKAIIIGSNFPFYPGTLEELQKTYKMENYSKADSGPMVSNSNANM